MSVTVELYGLPRLRAGADRCEVPAGRLRDVLRDLAARLPGLVPDIIQGDALGEHALIAIDGRDLVIDLDHPCPDGTILVMISAQAGG